MTPFMFLVVLLLDLGFTDTNNIGRMRRKSKCSFCTIFSLSQIIVASLASTWGLPGNLRVHFESEYLNLESHRAEICTHF